jgi:hypothetical protein
MTTAELWQEKLVMARKQFEEIEQAVTLFGNASPNVQLLVWKWFKDYARDFLEIAETHDGCM